ncbi:hypothetical protein EfsSVR2085_36120 (plasmid) [Enterococcus faecalis]|nr:hypothetical protein EfsSVR2085_36120 [Enterococcus faecalis]
MLAVIVVWLRSSDASIDDTPEASTLALCPPHLARSSITERDIWQIHTRHMTTQTHIHTCHTGKKKEI